MNQIGDRIAVNRQNKQMTQEEFALRLGVTPQAVSKWERSQGLPDIGLLEGICKILSIDANELLGLEIPKAFLEKNDLSMQSEIQKNMIAEPLLIEFGVGLIQVFTEGLKTDFVNEQREKLAAETGMLMPILRIRDNMDLQENEVQIKSYGKVLKRTMVDMAADGIFQCLIRDVIQECKKNYSGILNKQLVKFMMDTLKSMYPGEIDGIVPEKISYLMILDIMKEILNKNGTIKNQIKIVEIVEREVLQNDNRKAEDIADKIIKSL